MKLPKMQCDQCGRCCGIIFCTGKEFKAIDKYIEEHNVVPVAQGINCPFLTASKGCAIYPVRPYICRIYGHTHTLKCYNGHNKNISLGDLARLDDEFMPKSTAVCLHELCYTSEEIGELIKNYKPL